MLIKPDNSTASKSNINATLRGGLRTGQRGIKAAPLTIYVPSVGQYHVTTAGEQALAALAAKRAALGEVAPGATPTALGATLAACAARAKHTAMLRARAAAGLPPPRKPRRKSAGAMAASPRSAQSRANDAQYRRARRALEKYAAAQGCRLTIAKPDHLIRSASVAIRDTDGAALVIRSGNTVRGLLRGLCLTFGLEV